MFAQLSKVKAGATAELSFSGLVARYELERLPKKATTSQYNERYRLPRLVAVFGEMVPQDIEPHHVWTYWTKRGENSDARHEIRILSAILTFARQIGAVSGDRPNPCHKLGLPGEESRDRYVTDEEFLIVRTFAPSMVAFAMDLAFMCGMDRSTILSLEKCNLTERGIEFLRSKTSRSQGKQKTQKQLQVIEWTPELREKVDEILACDPRLRTALICTQTGSHYTAGGFKALWHRTLEAALKPREQGGGGLAERFHFHDLRAKSASDAETDQQAADRLGHASVATTRRVYRRLPRLAQPAKMPGSK
jgi:integrase